jgi:glutamate dehydrogenase
MTDEVAALVLRNNYLQCLAISGLQARSKERIFELGHVIRALERSGTLDRALEALPTDEEIVERHRSGLGLTRPELAMLLSYSKIWLSSKLLESDVASDPYLGSELTRYFPMPVQRRFAQAIGRHQLRREIIVTATTNSLVNRMGPVFAIRTQEDTGADIGNIARAFAIAREIAGMRELWADIEALDDQVSASLQYDIGHETVRLLRPLTYWVLRQHGHDLDIERAVSRLRPGLRELSAGLPGVIEGIEAKRYERELARFSQPGVPPSVARRVASLGALHSGVDIVEVALARRAPIRHTARVYFGLGAAIGLDWIRDQIERLAVEGHWQALARGTKREDAYALQRRLCERIVGKSRRGDAAAAVESWLAGAGAAADNVRRAVQEMRTTGAADFPTLSVALQAVRRLAER